MVVKVFNYFVLNKGKPLNIYKAEFLSVKYSKTFEEFERELKSSPENFEAWDDYMEWKACVKTLSKKFKR